MAAESGFRLPAGGYISKRSDNIDHFPLGIIDLKTGFERNLTLDVPFHGEVPDPETNFCSEEQRSCETNGSTLGPYLHSTSRFEVSDHASRVAREQNGIEPRK